MRIVKKILIYFSLGIFLFFSLLVFYIYFNRQEIKSETLKLINQNLPVPIKTGEINIDFFTAFPSVKISLKQVQIPPMTGFTKDICSAEKCSLKFNIWNILQKKYTISGLELDNAKIVFEANREGKYIFDQFQSNQAVTENSAYSLNYCQLENVNLEYINDKDSLYLNCHIKSQTLNGFNKKDFYKWQSKGYIDLDSFISGEIKLSNIQNIYIETGIQSTEKKGEISFVNSRLLYRNIVLSGKAKWGREYHSIHLSEEVCPLSDIISLLPIAWKNKLKPYETEGKIKFNIDSEGADSNTGIIVQLKCTDGKLKYPSIQQHIEKIYFETRAEIYPSQPEKNLITFPNLSLKAGNSILTGHIIYGSNINIQLSGKGDLQDLIFLDSRKQIQELDGIFNLDLSVIGNKYNISRANYDKIESRLVNFSVSGGSFKLNNTYISDLKFSSRLKQDNLELENLYLKIDSQEANLNVSITNFWDYLFKNKTPTVSVNAYIPRLIIKENNSRAENNGINWIFPGKYLVSMDQFFYNKIQLEKIKFQMTVNENYHISGNLSTQFCGGKINVSEMTWNPVQREINVKAHMAQIKVSDLFYSFNNFSQNNLTHENIYGILSSDDVQLKFELDSFGKAKYEKMEIEADVNIKEGRLKHYAPVMKLSSYLKKNDFSDLHFAELKNHISMKNGIIVIPEMQILSTAARFYMSGHQDLSMRMDYSIRILFSDLIKQKYKKTEYDVNEDTLGTGNQGRYIQIRMKGTPDQLNFTLENAPWKKNTFNGKNKLLKKDSSLLPVKKKLNQLSKKFSDPTLNPESEDSTPVDKIHWDE